MPPLSSTSASPEFFDLTIIGGGPVGLFASFYAGLRQMKTKIIDSLDELGGQLTTLYPEKLIFDVAGFSQVLARDLARNLIEQAMRGKPTVCLGEIVSTLEPISEIPEHAASGAVAAPAYRITSDKGVHYTRTLLSRRVRGRSRRRRSCCPRRRRWRGTACFIRCGRSRSLRGRIC